MRFCTRSSFSQLFDKLQVAKHDHQQIVGVVGHAASQLSDRLHLLGLHELALGSFRSVMHWHVPKIWSTWKWLCDRPRSSLQNWARLTSVL
jgi:hypothetical protein